MSDYSCYVAIDASKCSSSLVFQNDSLTNGSWGQGATPPSQIPANTTTVPSCMANIPSEVATTSSLSNWPIICQAASGTWTGSNATVTYTTEDGVIVTINFCCSWSDGNNSGSITLSSNPGNRYITSGYYASNEGGAYLYNNVPTWGHPSYFIFIISTTD